MNEQQGGPMSTKVRLAMWIKWHPRFVPARLWEWAVRRVDEWHVEQALNDVGC